MSGTHSVPSGAHHMRLRRGDQGTRRPPRPERGSAPHGAPSRAHRPPTGGHHTRRRRRLVGAVVTHRRVVLPTRQLPSAAGPLSGLDTPGGSARRCRSHGDSGAGEHGVSCARALAKLEGGDCQQHSMCGPNAPHTPPARTQVSHVHVSPLVRVAEPLPHRTGTPGGGLEGGGAAAPLPPLPQPSPRAGTLSAPVRLTRPPAGLRAAAC